MSQPMPPPRLRPPTPVWPTMPPVVARPCAWVSWSTSPHRAPPWTWAMRPAGSTVTARIADRSITIPSSHVAVPATLWPPPRTAISRSRWRAKRTAAATSAVPRQRATNRGRRSMVAFHTTRASSYPSWPEAITSPPNLGICIVAGAVIVPPLADGLIATLAAHRREVSYLDFEVKNLDFTTGTRARNTVLMRTYGQYCPIARGAEIFAERWTPLIIRNVQLGCETFGEI